MTVRVRIWDLPTRVFHWALAAAVIGAAVTSQTGPIEWHARMGYTVLGLLAFRLIWGFVGGHWSRFGSFLYSPASVWRYLKGQAPAHHTAGHSPLGALSVFALLAVLALQVGAGLFADDEILFRGPLAHLVSGDTVSALTGYHKAVGKWLVAALVLLHLVAVLVYLARRHNLITPMIKGDKSLDVAVPESRDGLPQRLVALVVACACAALVWWVSRLGL